MASARARRGALVTIGLVIAIAIIVLIARRGDDARPAREASGGSATDRAKTARHAIDPTTGVPRWFGQRGAAARRIAGIVLLDGAPVPGATVRLASKVTAAGLGAEARVVADGSGQFDLGRQPAGAYLIVAEMPRLTSAIKSIDLRDPTNPVDQLRLALHACDASIHGTITDSAGGVIPKARVMLSDGRLTTGAGAEASDDGTYELCVPVGGAGVVVDQNDAPVAGVSLSFTLLRGRDFGTATTADDGTFSARALSGGGEYAYEVRQGDGASLSYPPATGRRHPPIMVRDGQSQITGVRIKIRRERLSIAGRVLDAAGAPVADVAVTAMPVGGYSRSPSAASDETGAFTIRDLPVGTYNVHARAARSDQHEENVAAGRTDLVLRLPGVGGIDGTLAGFTVVPEIVARRMNGGGTRHRATITGETFVFRDLPAGTYQVVATSSSGLDFASVEVPPAALVKLALRQRGFGTIAGTVVDEATRAPLAGLRCHLFTEAEIFGHDRPNADTAVTDSKGAYRVDGVLAGTASVTCANDTTHARGESEVTAGQTTQLDLTARTTKVTRRAHIGLEIEVQLGETMVKSVEPGGAAAGSGLVVGDVILMINDRTVPRWRAQDLVSEIEDRSYGTSLKIAIERADKPLTVLLTVEPAP